MEETQDDITSITQEIHALVEAKMCPQLINYKGSLVLGTKLWIIMEFVGGGSVRDKVCFLGVANIAEQAARKDGFSFVQVLREKGIKENQIAIIVREVLLGLAYLELDGKFHRDIKGKPLSLTLLTMLFLLKLPVFCLSKHNSITWSFAGANILIADDGQVKLADFGATKQLTETVGHKTLRPLAPPSLLLRCLLPFLTLCLCLCVALGR